MTHPKMRSSQWCRLADTKGLSSAAPCLAMKSLGLLAQGGSSTASTDLPFWRSPNGSRSLFTRKLETTDTHTHTSDGQHRCSLWYTRDFGSRVSQTCNSAMCPHKDHAWFANHVTALRGFAERLHADTAGLITATGGRLGWHDLSSTMARQTVCNLVLQSCLTFRYTV